MRITPLLITHRTECCDCSSEFVTCFCVRCYSEWTLTTDPSNWHRYCPYCGVQFNSFIDAEKIREERRRRKEFSCAGNACFPIWKLTFIHKSGYVEHANYTSSAIQLLKFLYLRRESGNYKSITYGLRKGRVYPLPA